MVSIVTGVDSEVPSWVNKFVTFVINPELPTIVRVSMVTGSMGVTLNGMSMTVESPAVNHAGVRAYISWIIGLEVPLSKVVGVFMRLH